MPGDFPAATTWARTEQGLGEGQVHGNVSSFPCNCALSKKSWVDCNPGYSQSLGFPSGPENTEIYVLE